LKTGVDFGEQSVSILLVMTNYSSLRNLSVVHHNNLLVTRRNEATEGARLAMLDALLAEQDALLRATCEPTKAHKATLALARKAVVSCSRYYFARKEIDDTLAPTFWVKG